MITQIGNTCVVLIILMILFTYTLNMKITWKEKDIKPEILHVLIIIYILTKLI